MSDFTDPKDYSVVRRILRSEVTWLIAAGLGVAMFYQNVIIPINNIQIQLANIQATLQSNAQTLSDFNNRITTNSNDIIKLQQQIGQVRQN